MKNTKHTPGPWHGDSDDPDTTRWAVCTDSQPQYFVATVENGAVGDALDTEGVNARLIAAAPDLYEAAKKALTCASLNSDVRALIVAAIARVEEKQ